MNRWHGGWRTAHRIACGLGVMLFASPAAAQRISGIVGRESGPPVSGAVVLLLAETRDSVLARGVTSASGRFLLSAPAGGVYRVQVLRIGQRPVVQGPWQIGADETRNVAITVAEEPVRLARFDVKADGECRNNPAANTLVGQLLTESRTAFLASVSALPEGAGYTSYRLYERPEDLKGEPLAPEMGLMVTRASARPFESLPPDSIRKIGYVSIDGDSVIYRAPDAEVLLSDGFLATHCFQVVEGVGGNTGAMGIAFRPTARRRGVVDIRGTIWMRPDTALPRVVEFQYDPVSREEEKASIGGMVEFATTTAGTWFVRSFALRMPRLLLHRVNAVLGRRPIGGRVSQALNGIIVRGGDVLEVRVGERALFVDSAALRYARSESDVAAARDNALQQYYAADTTRRPAQRDSSAAQLTVRVRGANDSLIAEAEVVVASRSGEVVRRTDTFGAVRFEALPPDTIELTIRRLGLEAETHVLLLATGENELSLQMRATGTVLDKVTTVADRPMTVREAEIDNRIRAGIPSDFVRRDYIDKVNPISLPQMLQRLRGISITTIPTGEKVAVSSRQDSPSLIAPGKPCVLRTMVDNIIMPENYSLDNVPPMEVYAIELFQPSRIPPQFSGTRTNIWCGLIAIWTRSQ